MILFLITYWQMFSLIAYADTVELTVFILVRFFVYIHTLCIQAAKDLMSLHIYTGLLKPSFLALLVIIYLA